MGGQTAITLCLINRFKTHMVKNSEWPMAVHYMRNQQGTTQSKKCWVEGENVNASALGYVQQTITLHFTLNEHSTLTHAVLL